jgi:prolipoprotein diacylglyceryltransferase
MLPYPEFDPVAIQLGPFAVRWYALSYIAGLLGRLVAAHQNAGAKELVETAAVCRQAARHG